MTVLLIDASAYIWRAFYSQPPLTRSDGVPTGAVNGYCHMLHALIEQKKDVTHIAVIFDKARRSFRHDIYPDYKATRKPTPDDLKPQFDLVRRATEAFGFPIIEADNIEADDLIASYAAECVSLGLNVEIVSSDKDLMQLVCSNVWMWCPIKKKVYDVDGVRERFGVGPEVVVDAQSLIGDPTDNIPGVPGIGEKTATALLKQFGSLDALLDRAGEIAKTKLRAILLDPRHRDAAMLSRKLVTLRRDAALPVPIDALTKRPVDRLSILAFAAKMEFKGFATKIEETPAYV